MFFFLSRKNHAKGGQRQKATSFCQKEAKKLTIGICSLLVYGIVYLF